MKLRITTSLLTAVAAALLAVSPALASGGTGGGGGGGGGTTTTTVANPLPTTPPAPGVILRESFGFGVDPVLARPQGGNGNLRQVFGGTDPSGFWVEYPGSKNEQWVTGAGGWKFAGASLNSYETLPSPIQQPSDFNGIIVSPWTSQIPASPDALIPFRGTTGRYTASAEMLPAVLDGSYSGFGLTTSGATQSNLPAGGQIWVRFSQVPPFGGADGQYEVLSGSRVLASAPLFLGGFTQAAITVDPAAQTVSVAINGNDVGTWPDRVTPSFLAFEGQGLADDLVVRSTP